MLLGGIVNCQTYDPKCENSITGPKKVKIGRVTPKSGSVNARGPGKR